MKSFRKVLKVKRKFKNYKHQNEEMRHLTKSASWSNAQAQEEQCQRIGLLQGTCLKRGQKAKLKNKILRLLRKLNSKKKHD